MTSSILNLSAYRFVTLDALDALRQHIADQAAAAGLRGTVLLAEEGINLFVAGEPAAARAWLAGLGEDPRLAGLQARESFSDTLPFRRLRVKIKREIIRMDQPQICPQQRRAPALDPDTLARWLDAGHDDTGREVVLLDTRNAWEADAGAFDGALDWRLAKFSDFPAAAQAHRGALEGRTVVTYCTGGIRCEKAALALQATGLERVWQLDGGILGYLERLGARHWHGDCVVFDERGAVDERLAPTAR